MAKKIEIPSAKKSTKVTGLDVLLRDVANLSRQKEAVEPLLASARTALLNELERLGLAGHSLPDGSATATLTETTSWAFDVPALTKILSTSQLDVLFPRKPDAAKLREIMTTDPNQVAGLKTHATSETETKLTVKKEKK